jgi:hypothetical protein
MEGIAREVSPTRFSVALMARAWSADMSPAAVHRSSIRSRSLNVSPYLIVDAVIVGRSELREVTDVLTS